MSGKALCSERLNDLESDLRTQDRAANSRGRGAAISPRGAGRAGGMSMISPRRFSLTARAKWRSGAAEAAGSRGAS